MNRTEKLVKLAKQRGITVEAATKEVENACWSIDEFNEVLDQELDHLPLQSVITVGEMIVKLQSFPEDLPLLLASEEGGWIVHPGEFFTGTPKLRNLNEQNTDGDPQFYGSQQCVVIQ